MSEEEQKTHWINNELLTPEERIAYQEREIELAREFAAQEERKQILKALSEAGVGYYIGAGLFRTTGPNGEEKIISL